MNPNLIPNEREMYLGKSCASISLLNRSLVSASIAAVSLTLLSTAGTAATLFSDDFTGMHTGVGQSSIDLNTDGWYFTGNGSTPWRVGTDDTAPLSGNAMQNYGSSGGWTTGLKQFTPVSLTNTGDFVSVTLDYHTLANIGWGFLKISLLGSSSTVGSNNFTGTSAIPDADGYATMQYSSATATTAGFVKTTDDSAWNTSPFAYTSGSAVIGASSSAHAVTFTLTKVASGIELNYLVDGNSLGTSTVTTSVYNTFNTITLMDTGSDGSNPVYLDNISVTTNVPEPSSVALMAFAGGLCLLGRFHAMRRRL